jgi:hypothetical protein
MAKDRSRYGLLVSALGAVLLLVSVFLPWYAVSLTAPGSTGFLAHLWGGALGGSLPGSHGLPAAHAGQHLGGLTALESFAPLSIVLMVLAAMALLDALAPLAQPGSPVPEGAGRAVVPLGLLAAVAVAYRMVSPPTPAGGAVALSLEIGAWLALLGALTMVMGGMWPRTLPAICPPDGTDMWSSLTGWSSTV